MLIRLLINRSYQQRSLQVWKIKFLIFEINSPITYFQYNFNKILTNMWKTQEQLFLDKSIYLN